MKQWFILAIEKKFLYSKTKSKIIDVFALTYVLKILALLYEYFGMNSYSVDSNEAMKRGIDEVMKQWSNEAMKQ
jgi:hypothetical protein